MTPQELKYSIICTALQGMLVKQYEAEIPVDLCAIKQKKTEELEFDIPEKWKVAHLETVTNGIPAKQYQILESEVQQMGKHPVISQSKAYSIGFSDNFDKVFHHTKPVIVFGDHTTEVKYVDFDFIVGADGVKIFEPIDGIVTAGFLFYVFLFYSKDLSKVGGYSRHYKYIKNKPIPLPPLAEQKRIVAKIEELLPYIDRYEQAWSRLEDFNKRFPVDMQKSILQMAIQGKLVTQLPDEDSVDNVVETCRRNKEASIEEGRYRKEPFRGKIIDEAIIPYDIPDSWAWMYISDMSLFQEGPGILAVDFRTFGVPLIRIAGMQSDVVSLDGCNYLDEEMVNAKWNHFRLDEGDIVISTSASMDKIAEVDSDTVGAIPYTGLIRFKMYGGISKEYFKWFIKSPFYAEQVNEQKAGGTIKHYGPSHLKKMLIPIPPLAEQKRIVAKLEEILPLCDRLK